MPVEFCRTTKWARLKIGDAKKRVVSFGFPGDTAQKGKTPKLKLGATLHQAMNPDEFQHVA